MKKQILFSLVLVFMISTAGISFARAYDRSPEAVVTCADCKIDNNLSLKASEFIGKCCKGSIKAEFPSELMNNTVKDIRDNKSKNDKYKTAWKLISRDEYRK